MGQGIEHVKQVIAASAKFGNLVDAALADGKINLADVGLVARVPEIATGLFAAVTNFKDLKAEFADLDPEERKQLVAYFKENFDLAEDNVEAAIEQGAELIDTAWDVFKAFAVFAKQFKKT